MPIYEYKCTKGHVFEIRQSFTDDSLTKCEVCGAPVQKVLHPVAINFKGSGFYNTDYGTKRRAREREKESASSKSESSSSSTSSDSSSSTSSDSGSKSETAKKPDSSSSASSEKKPTGASTS